jgi:kumamolisin
MYQRSHERSPRAAVKTYRFLRLPGRVDPEPLVEEMRTAAPEWLPSQWKWHLGTDFLILRGGPSGPYPGSELVSGGDHDLPILERLPRMRAFLDVAFPVPARVAWVGLSPAGSWIHLHVDNTKHWDEHHRVHIPLVTTPAARLCVDGRFLHLAPGFCWAFNNSRPHGALNDGPDRLHLMVDLPPVPEVEAWLAAGEPVEGEPDPLAFEKLRRDPLQKLPPDADPSLAARLRQQ